VPAASPAPQAQNPKPPPQPHTSVVYFHGIGSQRRYEELSRLLDSLDRYANWRNDPANLGIIYDIEPRLEEPRAPLVEDTSFVRVRHRRDAGGEFAGGTYRFYEVYWAPIMAGGVPALQVMRWLLASLPAPVRALWTPWRLRARLRRSALQRWWSSQPRPPKRAFEERDLSALLRSYNYFEGPEARREYPRGSYRQFREYLLRADKGETPAEGGKENEAQKARARLASMTTRWHAHYIYSELRNVFALLTLVLVIVIGAGAAAAAVVLLLKLLGGAGVARVVGRVGLANLDELLTPSLKNVAAILVMIAGLAGVTKFLRDYLGDVQVWTTYEETNEKSEKRKEVLKMSAELLRHVLSDEACGRVVVVGHSLGTTIAHDALLQLGRHNRARRTESPMSGPLPLEKLDLFLTLGSPVDKVHYFFESHAGKYHRYNRVVEALRGDIGEAPFAKNRKPHIHWINFWDQADVISSSLETPSNKEMGHLLVDNFHAPSFVFPSPGASHSAYFEHRRVVGVLFDAIFNGKHSFKNAPRLPPRDRPDYAAQVVGPGEGLRVTKPLQALMLLLPWLVLAAVVSRLTDSRAAQSITLFLSCVTAAFLVAVWLYSRARGHLARF
jgi:hypothetical protein